MKLITGMLGRKLHSGTSKTTEHVPVQYDFEKKKWGPLIPEIIPMILRDLFEAWNGYSLQFRTEA